MTFSLSTHCRSKEHQNLSGRLSPSGRFSVCQLFPKKKKRLNDEQKPQAQETPVRCVSDLDTIYRQFTTSGIPDMCPVRTPNQGEPGMVGLSIAPNSGKRKKRGSAGASARSRDVICWAANQMEFAHKKENMSFLTYTLPPMRREELTIVQSNWSKIVHETVKEIRRQLKSKGVPTHVVGCTEIQLERKRRTGFSYPHLHLVFRGRRHSRTDWALQPKQFRSIFRTVVLRFLGNVPLDWTASENVQPIKKSSGGYLAKYLSKPDSKGESQDTDSWHPTDWAIVSRSLRGLYARLTYNSFELGGTLLDVVRQWTEGMGWIRPIELRSRAYGIRRIGYYGWLIGEEKYVSCMELFSLI